MFGFVSTAGDFSTNARNDNVFVWFIMSFWLNVAKPFLAVRFVYTVISTGVRTIARTQRRNPPRKRYKVRVRHVRLPFHEISPLRYRFARNDSIDTGVRSELKWFIIIKRRTRPYSLSFRGSEVTVGIAPARRGGTKYRKKQSSGDCF